MEYINSVNGRVLALLLRSPSFPMIREGKASLQFFSEEGDQMQVALMTRPIGEVIAAHWHRPVERKVHGTPEVIFVKKGRLKVTFYNPDETPCAIRQIGEGDVLVLLAGGHGFEVLEEAELFEVKQGPYLGANDKVKFTPKEIPEREVTQYWIE